MPHPYARQLARLLYPIEADQTDHPDILLDSGAYGVWRSGVVVDPERYTTYCGLVKDITLSCVNLDQIPGRWGQPATHDEVETACEVSFSRWWQLCKTGAFIMPVYHQGDDLKWLHKYLDHGALYIGISPNDAFSMPSRQRWLHEIHAYIDRCGLRLNQDVFTHCLGVFSPRVLYDLPAWSADASTVLRYVSWKRVLMPKYDQQTKRICGWEVIAVSSRPRDLLTNFVRDQPTVWRYVTDYLDTHAIPYTLDPGGRVVIDDVEPLILANLVLAKLVMRATGIRCFIAGQHAPAIYSTIVTARYPYILRSFAIIQERSGVTIQDVYNRTIPKPNRRTEQDSKVEASRGLFP